MTSQEMMTELSKATLPIPVAGKLLGISRDTAYDAARSGDLPTLRFGRRLVVPTSKLREMLGLPPQKTAA
ncbi:helix-turn-helix domain-containing protein [Methylobacterium sp. A54F]